MSQYEDVRSAESTSSASLVSTACRVKGMYVRSAGTAGTVTLKDGGSGGTAKVVIDTPALVTGIYIPFPDNGVVFSTSVYAALSQADAVTIFYALG